METVTPNNYIQILEEQSRLEQISEKAGRFWSREKRI